MNGGFKALNLFHRTILRASGARLGSSAFGMRIVELHTIGRRSGRERTVLLAAPFIEGERIVLVASKGGDDRNPDWFENLVAHPDVEVTVGRDRRALRARVASAKEAAELWPRVVAAYAPYASYRQRAKREIPLVICEPR
ncbi:MAG: nitroreductase family deazaflavin-dependent oxidoreductase [Acidobacteriota bacterium]|nr:nitroreductase family deazaflavin-dependent oxidoreductase [Acidobacteriota bacterium]